MYDGPVGYYSSRSGAMLGEQTPVDELDLSTLRYFPSGGSSSTEITKDSYLRVSPYHISASNLEFAPDDIAQNQAIARRLANAHCTRMSMVGALFDPSSKVHVYAGVIPVGPL